MRFRISDRIEFVPGVWPTITLALLLPVLIFLGFWQLHRAGEKEALQIQKAAKATAQPYRLTGDLIDPGIWNHSPVIAEGVYESRFHILLDNRLHKSQPGFYVVTPFKIQGSDVRVLVSRGWVPLGKSREQLPVIDSPVGELTIHGRTRLSYADRFKLNTGPASIENGINIWQTMEIEAFAKLVSYKVQPVIVELDPDQEEGGYLREWVVQAGTPASKNVGYAVQWFALATLLAGLYFFLNIRNLKA